MTGVQTCALPIYPPAGETSGIAIRLMGIGKPVILSTGLETSNFPDGTCVRVETGVGEEDMLADVLLWLSRHRRDSRAIGLRASEYIMRVHALDVVAELYRKCLRGCYDGSALLSG